MYNLVPDINKKLNKFVRMFFHKKQAREDLNPQHSVLETDALPIELRAYLTSLCSVCFRSKGQYLFNTMRSVVFFLFLEVV